jgi:hypothetical protein
MIRKMMLDAFPEAYIFMPVQSGYGRGGVPDFVCCIHGLFITIEAKAPGGAATGRQLNEMRLIRRSGGYAKIVENAMDMQICIEEVRAILDTAQL